MAGPTEYAAWVDALSAGTRREDPGNLREGNQVELLRLLIRGSS